MDFTFSTAIGLIELIAIVAVAVACWQINAQRKLAKQNNSIDKMWELQEDGNLRRSMNVVAKMLADGEKVESYASRDALKKGAGKNDWDEDSRRKSHALDAVVEYFELISIGILQDIYDREIVRAYARDIFVEMHERVKPFIREMRAKHSRSYGENFQRVAEEFREKKNDR